MPLVASNRLESVMLQRARRNFAPLAATIGRAAAPARLFEWRRRSALVCGALLAALAAPQCSGWPDGAPCFDDVLANMYPASYAHEGGERPDKVPYVIELSHTCYHPQKDVKLTLRGVSRDWRFKGFMVQARDPGTTSGFGEFVRDDNGSWKYQCYNVKHAITHSHGIPKFKLEAYWQFNRRQRAFGNVQFVATVVADKKNYWVQQVRSIVLVPCRQGNESSHLAPFDITYPQAVKRTTLPPLRVHVSRLIARSSGLRYGNELGKTSNPFFTPKPDFNYDYDGQAFAAAEIEAAEVVQPEIRETHLAASQAVPVRSAGQRNACRDQLAGCQSWIPFCNSNKYSTFLTEQCAKTCSKCH